MQAAASGIRFLRRNAYRLRGAFRSFHWRRRQAGTAHALSETLFDFRFYAFKRFDWLVDRLHLRGLRSTRLLKVAWPEPVRHGVLCIGYVEAGLGLGESLRSMIGALSGRSIRFAIWPFRLGVETRAIGPFMPERYDFIHTYRVNLLEMAADQLPHVVNVLGPERLARSYNILRTYWELPSAPASWAADLSCIDEIWAPTAFVAEAFRPIFSGPIVLVPPCIDVEQVGDFSPGVFQINEDRFYFLFSFDLRSHTERKNPLGVLAAWQAAFTGKNEGVGLVLKMIGPSDEGIHVRDSLRRAMEADARIVLIDQALTRAEMLALIRYCDCYVSLHRSEGFGLGMAEAMAFGNVVIGTDFSGSRDFLTNETGYPVPYEVRPVHPGEYPFAEGQFWAEPDIDAASTLMRDVFLDEETRRRRSATGKEVVRAQFGRTTVGRIAEARLQSILRPRERLPLIRRLERCLAGRARRARLGAKKGVKKNLSGIRGW